MPKSPRMGWRSSALFHRSYRLCPPANARALTSSNGVSGLPVRFRVSKMVHTASSDVPSGRTVTGNAYFTSGSMQEYSTSRSRSRTRSRSSSSRSGTTASRHRAAPKSRTADSGIMRVRACASMLSEVPSALDAEHLDRLIDVGTAEERAEVEEEARITDAVDRLVERGQPLLAVEDEVRRTLGERRAPPPPPWP